MKPNEYTGAKVYHEHGCKGEGVIIAVVDTGVAHHPDLDILEGWGYQGIPPDEDASGHGTHVAGIAAGKKYGVAPAAKILPVRITAHSTSTGAILAQGLEWLIEWKKKHSERLVVNISFSGTTTPAVLAAINELVKNDVPVCVAAGNDSKEIFELGYYESPVVVGNLTGSGKMADTSNCRGEETDCVTVGTTVYSCDTNGGYCYKSGTSMASPAVAGMLALIFSRWSALSEPAAVAQLLRTGRDELVKCISGQHYIPHVSFANVPFGRDDDKTSFIPVKMKIQNLPSNKAAVIRKTPGGTRLTSIKNGRIVTGLEVDGNYQQISYPISSKEVGVGWIAKKYVGGV